MFAKLAPAESIWTPRSVPSSASVAPGDDKIIIARTTDTKPANNRNQKTVCL